MDSELLLTMFALLISVNAEDKTNMRDIETRLISDIKKRANDGNFSLSDPPEEALVMGAVLFMKHVIIEEDRQIVTIHGRLYSMWNDNRWTWNYTEYSKRLFIARSLEELRDTIWVPELQFLQIGPRWSGRIDRGDADASILIYSGFFELMTTVSLDIACDFDGAEYPFDLVTCTFFLVSSLDASRLSFAQDHTYVGLHQDHTENWEIVNTKNFHSGEFFGELSESQAIYVDVGGTIVEAEIARNSTKEELSSLSGRTMFEIIFERHVPYYFATMLAPLIVIVVLIIIIAFLPISIVSFHTLLGLLACQLLFGYYLASTLPKTYSKMPVIALLAIAEFSLNIFTILLKVVPIYLKNRNKGTKIWKTIERYTLVVTISLPTILLCVILLHCYHISTKLRE